MLGVKFLKIHKPVVQPKTFSECLRPVYANFYSQGLDPEKIRENLKDFTLFYQGERLGWDIVRHHPQAQTLFAVCQPFALWLDLNLPGVHPVIVLILVDINYSLFIQDLPLWENIPKESLSKLDCWCGPFVNDIRNYDAFVKASERPDVNLLSWAITKGIKCALRNT